MKCSDVYRGFFRPGEVTEIRAYGLNRKGPWEGWAHDIVYGYFDNAEDFGNAAEALDKAGAGGVYFVLNLCQSGLLARAKNRLKGAGRKDPLTSDKNIETVRWLYIDIDPGIPSGISSTAEEYQSAVTVGGHVAQYLEREMGWPAGVRASSGNGVHLLYPLEDLQPTDENKDLIKKCLAALKHKFRKRGPKVDETVCNASRICKVYGTVARKGDNTEERPHRRSYLKDECIKPYDEWTRIPRNLLETLAKLAPDGGKKPATSTPQPTRTGRPGRSERPDLGRFVVERYLTDHGIAFFHKRGNNAKGVAVDMYCLDECLFDSSHRGNDASIVQDDAGKVTYQCFHDSCRGYTWRDARAKISGDKKLGEYCENWDPALAAPPKYDQRPADRAASSTPPEEDQPGPGAFFKQGKKGPRFVSPWLTNYLDERFSPLVFDGADFYHYFENGVWRRIHGKWIAQSAEKVLQDEARNNRIIDAIKLLEARKFVDPENFKHDPSWLNIKNGMLNVETLEEPVPHDPDYLSRIQLNVRRDPAARCDRWLQFVEEVFPWSPPASDPNAENPKAKILQRYMGYCLLPDCRFERCLFLLGSGANGKSVICDVLIRILGLENVSALPFSLMTERFLIGELRDKLVNIAGEVATGRPVSTENFKQAVTGGMLTADRKNKEPLRFFPIAKHIFAMNEAPRTFDKTHGFTRRPVVLTFTERFEGARRDPQLRQKLYEEVDGIFGWMLVGLGEVLDAGDLIVPDSVDEDTAEFMRGMNPVLMFVEECCVLGDNVQARPQELYEKYKEWCGSTGHKPRAMGTFRDQILMHFDSVVRIKTDGKRLYRGIGLKVDL